MFPIISKDCQRYKMGDEKMNKTDTVSELLTCRFCKENANLGVWLHEADEPEKMFICHSCWNLIASLFNQLLIPTLRDHMNFAEDGLREISVFRNVRVEAKAE